MYTLHEHKKGVQAMELHSTGKILFSFAKDQKLIMWNLLDGKRMFRK